MSFSTNKRPLSIIVDLTDDDHVTVTPAQPVQKKQRTPLLPSSSVANTSTTVRTPTSSSSSTFRQPGINMPLSTTYNSHIETPTPLNSRIPTQTSTAAAANTANRPSGSSSVDAAVPESKPKKLPIKDQPHALLWVPHNGAGTHRGHNGWSKLTVMGIYKTKQDAQSAKDDYINGHPDEAVGSGDICIGPSWSDEYDLVVKHAPTFL